jgi:parallel beta-helix repeat protein
MNKRRVAAAVFGVLVASVVGTTDSAAHVSVVSPGASIQAAVDAARPGDTVRVLPGTYAESGRKCPGAPKLTCAVVVKKDGIRLVAASSGKHHVTLVRRDNQDRGISIARTGAAKCLHDKKERVQGSLVQGFTVKGFKSDGVVLFCVDRWRVTRVRAVDDSVYGVFPSHVGSGRLDHSFASGANDTGLYIGQSHDVQVDHNVARRNLSGFEIENSTAVRIHHNQATGNTAGILSFTLPGLDVKVNRKNRIDHNNVHANNRRNACPEPGDIVCNVPHGTGILLVGADGNLVSLNSVKGNGTVGIGVASYCIVNGSSGSHCTNDIDPNPDNDHMVMNTALENGNDPDQQYAAFASDLGWDTTGKGNCWSGNTYSKSFPSSLPAC